jgi:hypothetical protein
MQTEKRIAAVLPHFDGAAAGVDLPHEGGTGGEILAPLALHLVLRVGGTEDFHGEVGNLVEDLTGREESIGKMVPR